MRVFSRCFWLHRADRRAGRMCPCWEAIGAVDETDREATQGFAVGYARVPTQRQRDIEMIGRVHGVPPRLVGDRTEELPRPLVAPEEQAAAYGPGGCGAYWVIAAGSVGVLMVVVLYAGWALGWWPL